MKTTTALLVLFFIILGGGYLRYTNSNPVSNGPIAQSDIRSTADGSASSSTAAPTPGTYTSAQVAAHSTSKSCWTSINGTVYDLTNWISQHPGGEAAILTICGKDGTQAFEAQHGRSGDTQPKEILATFKIGTLAS